MTIGDPTPHAEYVSLSPALANRELKKLCARAVTVVVDFKSDTYVLPQGATKLDGILTEGEIAEDDGDLIVTRLSISDRSLCTVDLALAWFALSEAFAAFRHADASLLLFAADSDESVRICEAETNGGTKTPVA